MHSVVSLNLHVIILVSYCRPLLFKLSLKWLAPLVWLTFSIASLLTYIVMKNLVLDLILAMQIEPAARILPSLIADRTLSGDIGILYGRVDSN